MLFIFLSIACVDEIFKKGEHSHLSDTAGDGRNGCDGIFNSFKIHISDKNIWQSVVAFQTGDDPKLAWLSFQNSFNPLSTEEERLSFRFLQTKTKTHETYAEEIDNGYAQAKSQAEALAREHLATGEGSFKDQDYRKAIEAFHVAALLAPEDKGMALAYHRAQEAFRRQEIHRLSTDATLDPATGQEEAACFNIAELLDLGADNRPELLRRLASISRRLSPEDRQKLAKDVFDKRVEAARRLTAAGAIGEAQQIEETLEVFASTESAPALAMLKQETSGRGDTVRKAFEAAYAEERPTVGLVQIALAVRRAYPDDAGLSKKASEALARYRAAYPLSMKETFYLRKLYYLSALRYARRVGDDVRDASAYLAEIQRRDPADEDADTLLDAMAREGLARE